MAKRRAEPTADRSGQVWVRIESFTRKWYISRTDLSAAERVDDEAQLELVATIEAITPAQKKHLGASMDISLLSAQVYSADGSSGPPFFGSLTLRGAQRSALAYLPPRPFWQLPGLIEVSSTRLSLGWDSMHRGAADLVSLFVGDETDLEELGSDCVRATCGDGVRLDKS